MNRRPTRADVAKRAGVSKTTVTYVLADRFEIAIPESTRQRVRLIAEELGYRPHAAAQALASGRTGAITVAFPIRIGSHYAEVLRIIERQTNSHGYHMVATTIGHVGIENVMSDLEALMNGLTDGIILVDTPAPFVPDIQRVMDKGKPLISCGVFTTPGTDRVRIDLSIGVKDALAHLLKSSPKRLAFFGPGIHDEESVLDTYAAKGDLDPRIFGYLELCKGHGLVPEIILGNPESRSASCEAFKNHIHEHGCPDALFCFNDSMAIAANRVVRELGKRVPEEVLIVGCDGVEEGEYMNPPLSTIVQPVAKMCERAWELMSHRLAQPDAPPQTMTVNAEFIVRGSSIR